jgi:ABC-type transport system involved in cytochrome bd biosynthesis fused ATPase/permease subunit
MANAIDNNEPARPESGAADEKAKLLRKSIADAIIHMRQNKRSNLRKASLVRIISVLLSAVATVLLGLQITGMGETFKSIAFVLGATVTMLNAFEPLFNFRASWMEHEMALAEMHRLQNKFEFYLAGTKPETVDGEKLAEFFESYNSIWKSLNQAWMRDRKTDRNPSG